MEMYSTRKILAVVALCALPMIASASVADDIRAKIADLRAQIARLEASLATVTATSTVATTTPAVRPVPSPMPCLALEKQLARGAADGKNGEVAKLQKFLAGVPGMYPEGLVTGTFGPATERALARWQKAQGVLASTTATTTAPVEKEGRLGDATRAALRKGCGPVLPPMMGTTTPPRRDDDHRPEGTTTPPLVGGDRDSHGCIGSAGYTWCGSTNQCIRPWEVACPVTPPATGTTTPPTACTMEYAPVCGNVRATTTATTYSNTCMARAALAHVVHPGACVAGETLPLWQ